MNYTYILECADGTYYTGWTNDIEKRVREHNEKRERSTPEAARR